MKNPINIFSSLLIIFSLLISCSDNANKEGDSNTVEIEKQPKTLVDLSAEGQYFGLNMEIEIPDTSGKNISIEMREGIFGGLILSAGKYFEIEIGLFEGDLSDKKNELANEIIFETSYLEEIDNGFTYKKQVKNSEREQFHFFILKEIDGVKYFVENTKDEDFKLAAINKMFEASQTLRAKTIQ